MQARQIDGEDLLLAAVSGVATTQRERSPFSGFRGRRSPRGETSAAARRGAAPVVDSFWSAAVRSQESKAASQSISDVEEQATQ
eukprot:COSAG02_NODE_710_length_18178_cov_14.361524_5_plen_84_part_00